MLDAPLLVLVDLETAESAPTGPSLELLTAARGLTGGDVIALALQPLGEPACAALAGAGATRLLTADLGESAHLPATAADAVVAAVGTVQPAAVLVVSDYRGKELAGRAAVLLDSACVSDATALEAGGAGDDSVLRASKLVLSGSWSTTVSVGSAGSAPIIAVRPGIAEVSAADGAPLTAEPLEVPVSAEAAAVRLVSREATSVAPGPALTEARTVVVGGRGVNGDFDLVRSLAEPLGAAVGATRVACDEGWIERSAQIGQTGETISPRLYIGLGVSGAVHHTSGIQGAGTVVAICDDSEAPIFEMADFGVVGDVTEVVPQLVEELATLRG
ncbi:electron transfer flavoprotein subunit alpha/FixB family protein [Actinomyces naeslundii]|uniref:Electron transfer flavoprotein subunit alpha/FixB family protein n=1 Tax=Actinomyces naeslundii TaxID=1655 RepID=A0AA47FHM1_ACTNA|nr:electron transfer flavoprotein subunit alpha/FixB family protein [Actinomyces naeslundii]OMG18918.1 electron transporter [Actinomyces naeslundii]PKY95352.1 electron transfer flavoprotein subunit alpha/FixB family protein [Actinomyces naeslundii]WAL43493.1 electron transfer flavoprotein subunit alpha/FixB family protein [Actinomyces naeslundii]